MGVCDIPIISNVCDVAGEAAATLVAAPFNWLASAMGEAAGWLIETMWTVFDSTTLVDVTATGYVSVYNLLFGIAVFIVLLLFCFQLILGLIKRDPTALSRAALGAAKAVLGSFLLLTLTGLALEIVDQLCIGLVQAAGETTGTMGDKITLLAAGLASINIAAPGVGAIVTIFLAGLMIAAVAIVWFSLLIRKALLLVAIVLGPIAFSGAVWDITRSWVGKWLAFVVALIASKLVLVVVFLIAITQIATPIELDLTAVTEPITGIVLLFIAAFAPYMVYRFISFLGFDMYHAMGSEQDAKNAMNRPVPTQTKPTGPGPKKVLDGDSTTASTEQAPASSAPAETSATAGTGASAGSGAGAAAGAGPVAAVVVGAEVAKEAATAGSKLGDEIGEQADSAAGGADQAAPNPQAPPSNAAPHTPAPDLPPDAGNEPPEYGKE